MVIGKIGTSLRRLVKVAFNDIMGGGMYFLWCFQGTSCDVIGTKHALPVVGHGQLVTTPPSPHPCSSLVGLGLGGSSQEENNGVGLGSDRTDSKGKDPAL